MLLDKQKSLDKWIWLVAKRSNGEYNLLVTEDAGDCSLRKQKEADSSQEVTSHDERTPRCISMSH